jgi:outer membrane immunogenic protein
MYRSPEGGYKDGPAYATVSWSGFYAGVNGGGGWANDKQLVDPASNLSPFYGVSPSGGFGGGQIGYSWQGILHPHLVLGIEADLQGSGINESATLAGTRYRFKSELDYFGTVRGRVGYAMDRALVYFTGGFAYGGLNKWSNDFKGGQTFDDTVTGYVLGGGLEYKISPQWSAKVEYQYLNFGKNDPCGGGDCFSQAVIFYGGPAQKDDDYHTVRAGLNYHVGTVYEPLK